MDQIGNVLLRLLSGPIIADDGKVDGSNGGCLAVLQRLQEQPRSRAAFARTLIKPSAPAKLG
jgi:hypothetical protein